MVGVVIAILYGLFGIFYMRNVLNADNGKNTSWLVLLAMFWPLLIVLRLLGFIVKYIIGICLVIKSKR